MSSLRTISTFSGAIPSSHQYCQLKTICVVYFPVNNFITMGSRFTKTVKNENDIWSYIKSKKLKTRKKVNVKLIKSSKMKDDRTVTDISAKRQCVGKEGDIIVLNVSLVKDKTTNNVTLSGLEIQVKSTLQDGFRFRDMCQLSNHTYIYVESCVTHGLRIRKLDCFYTFIQTYSFPETVELVYNAICTIDDSTIAVAYDKLGEGMLSFFSVKKKIKLLNRFSLPDSCIGVTSLDELLYVIFYRYTQVYTHTGIRLKHIQLPFTFPSSTFVSNKGLIYSMEWPDKLRTTHIVALDLNSWFTSQTQLGLWIDLKSVCADTRGNLFSLIQKEGNNFKERTLVKIEPRRQNGMTTFEVKSEKRVKYLPSRSAPWFDYSYHETMSDMVILIQCEHMDRRIYIDVSEM